MKEDYKTQNQNINTLLLNLMEKTIKNVLNLIRHGKDMEEQE